METGKSAVFAIVFAVLFVCVQLMGPPAHAAFFKKEFVVRTDEGRDILCDPYVVQENDYVTKLFKQRGQISRADYPRFLGIFKRINPDIRDIDKIYPGRRILIPLKILPPGTLAGQSSGRVTLPIIMISDLPDLMRENSSVYEVRAGDTVWDLIVKRFGGLHRKEYMKLKELVKRMNPELADINRIDVGQKIRIPESSVRNTLWYDAIFDAAGRIREKPEKAPPSVPSGKAQRRPSEADAPVGPPSDHAEAASNSNSNSASAQSGTKRPAPPPTSVYAKAARILNADLIDKGAFFFPRQGMPDYRLDLARTPVMELPGGLRLLFDSRGGIPEAAMKAVRKHWRDISVIRPGKAPTVRTLFHRICPLIDMDGCSNKVEFSDGGIAVTVRGEYIYDRPGGDGRTCLTFIQNEKKKTPAAIRRYLGHHWIEVEDWINRSGRFAPAHEKTRNPAPFVADNVRSITAGSPSGFVRQFLNLLGYEFRSNVEISFPYAGFRVNATTHMISTDNEKILVDFSDFKGDAIQSLESLGFRVIQIQDGMDYYGMASRLLSELSVSQKRPPLFWAAERRRIHNTSIRIPGTILTVSQGSEKETELLIPECEVPPEIRYFLAKKGLSLLQINNH